jgi:hypothetical protein
MYSPSPVTPLSLWSCMTTLVKMPVLTEAGDDGKFSTCSSERYVVCLSQDRVVLRTLGGGVCSRSDRACAKSAPVEYIVRTKSKKFRPQRRAQGTMAAKCMSNSDKEHRQGRQIEINDVVDFQQTSEGGNGSLRYTHAHSKDPSHDPHKSQEPRAREPTEPTRRRLLCSACRKTNPWAWLIARRAGRVTREKIPISGWARTRIDWPRRKATNCETLLATEK